MQQVRNLFIATILLLGLPLSEADAQSIQKVYPANVVNSANEIKNIFGDLIGVSEEEIINFYEHHWDENEPYSVSASSPKGLLTNIDQSLVNFEWSLAGSPPTDGYRVSSLRLSDGISQTNTTMGNSITLNLQRSMHLVVFQADYGTQRSELDIIIIERIMFFTGCACDCPEFQEVWNSSFGAFNTVSSYEWAPQSTSEIYKYEINYLNPSGVNASFVAKINFDVNDNPIAVQLDENSMVNFSFNDDEQTFLYSHMPEEGIDEILGPITFSQDPDAPDSNLSLLSYYANQSFNYPYQQGKIKLSKCKKRIKDRNKNPDQSNTPNDLNKPTLTETSHSFNANKTIQYQISEAQNISIYLLDNQGRFIKTIVNNTNKEKGTYQVYLDLSPYAKGVYYCILKTKNNRIPLSLLNIK